MAEWLDQASEWHEMYCHDLKVMSSNPSWVELEVLSTCVLSRTRTKHKTYLTIQVEYIKESHKW